jgi:hypothetical protein
MLLVVSSDLTSTHDGEHTGVLGVLGILYEWVTRVDI